MTNDSATAAMAQAFGVRSNGRTMVGIAFLGSWVDWRLRERNDESTRTLALQDPRSSPAGPIVRLRCSLADNRQSMMVRKAMIQRESFACPARELQRGVPDLLFGDE